MSSLKNANFHFKTITWLSPLLDTIKNFSVVVFIWKFTPISKRVFVVTQDATHRNNILTPTTTRRTTLRLKQGHSTWRLFNMFGPISKTLTVEMILVAGNKWHSPSSFTVYLVNDL